MITPNMLVDPTNIFLAPFAILFFYLYIKYYIKTNDCVSYKNSTLLSLLLITATLVKPAFTNIILVIIGIRYIIFPKKLLSSNLLHDLLIYTPSCIILIWQLILITHSPAGGSIEFAPYKVIGHYSKHPFISLFQAVEFPMLITSLYLIKTSEKRCEYLCYAWLFCFISYLIYALFSISGPCWASANLAWSYQIGLFFVYLFSIIEYGNILSLNKYKISNFWTNLCMINFSLIFLSGIHQFVKIFLGGFFL
jgi:hypothetical protein